MLSRSEDPALQAFRAFLVQETDCGRIVRQEEVSMIPVCLLDVRPGQLVLDLCAGTEF